MDSLLSYFKTTYEHTLKTTFLIQVCKLKYWLLYTYNFGKNCFKPEPPDTQQHNPVRSLEFKIPVNAPLQGLGMK